MDEGITYKRITRIYREETSKRALTPLEPDFFEKLNVYLSDLEAKLKEGGQPEAQDEYQKACRKRDQVFRLRSRKIANLAASKAGGATVDLEPLARPEREMFDAIVETISGTRSVIYDVSEPEPVCEPPVEAPIVSDSVVIRILEDVPPFAGVDGNYDLKKEDVASLPKNVAKALIKQGVAQEIHVE